MIQAVLWDVDGTLAETERDGHRVAFNRAFEDEGLTWRWDVARYGTLLRVTGGYHRLLDDMRTRGDAPPSLDERERLARKLHRRKNEIYAELLQTAGIALRPGVHALLDECRARDVRMGLVTTTSRVNVDALLRRQLGTDWTAWFDTIVCGEDVAVLKPSPEAYERALAQLRLGPLACIAIEDSPGGVQSARQADVPVVVTRSVYFEHVAFDGVIAIGPGFGRREGWQPACADGVEQGCITFDDLAAWHERMEFVSAHGD